MIRSAATSGWSTPKAAAIAVAAAMRSAIASPTQPAICAAARGQRPRTRKASSMWAYLLPGREERARQATAAATETPSSSSAIGQRGSAPLRRAEREHEREPERADGADRGRDPADRPEPPFVRQRAGEEREANGGSEPRRRDRVHERAGAVPGRGVRAGRRPAAARQRRCPPGCGSDERAGERGAGEPEPDRRGVREPVDPRGDAVAEQLRGRRQRDERGDRAQKEGEVALSQREFEVHLVTVVRRSVIGSCSGYRHLRQIFTLRSCRERSPPEIGSPPRQARACSRKAATRSTPAS